MSAAPSSLPRIHRLLWQLPELGIPYRIHADDLGLTPTMSDHIVECHDRGALQSASLIVNGGDAERAAALARERPGLRLHLHLNWSEGPPCAPPEQVSDLLDADGHLTMSFERLAWRSLSGNRSELVRQLAAEARAQAARFGQLVGAGPLAVDSHNHLHTLPAGFEAVMALHSAQPLAYVRLPREPWFWCGPEASGYLSLGPVKHALLNGLITQGRYAERLREAGIGSCDVFIGVLFTGRMSAAVVEAALPECFTSVNEVEFLFHPGQASAQEVGRWASQPALANYYTSPDRMREKAELVAV